MLIANLLMNVVQKCPGRIWAFSDLVGFCRSHLFNYTYRIRFPENPEKDWHKAALINKEQLALF